MAGLAWRACSPDDPEPDWATQPSKMLVRLFGAVPGCYAKASAQTYVDAGCPPTPLMHGTHDEMAPVAAARQLRARLERAGVPAAVVYLPRTDHTFDLVGARWSPAARVAIYARERFLAVISVTEQHAAACT